jgi:hypothetical protein
LAARWKVRLLNIHVFPFVQYRLTSTPLSATRLYQIQKLQRRMLLGVLRVQTIPSQTPLERAKARNAIASYWIMQFPWHSKIATAQIKFNDHIQRAAWHNCWAGLMTLFCDTPVHSRWLATGRLRRFFQGHIATRWQTSIDTCRVHSTDPWQILINKSSKFKGRFDLAAHQKREASISSIPECCKCAARHTRRQPLYKCSSGHFACIGHRCFLNEEWHCVHCKSWESLYL